MLRDVIESELRDLDKMYGQVCMPVRVSCHSLHLDLFE